MHRRAEITDEVSRGLTQAARATGCSLDEVIQVALWTFAGQQLHVKTHFVFRWLADHAGDPHPAPAGLARRLWGWLTGR